MLRGLSSSQQFFQLPRTENASMNTPNRPTSPMQTCHRQLRRNNPLKSRCTMLVNIRRKTLAAVKYVNSPDWYSASKLMSRRIELRGNEGGWNNDGTEAYCRGDHTHRRNPRRTGRWDRPFAFHQAKQRSTQSRRTCSGTGRRSYYYSVGLRCDGQKSDHHGDQASGVALTPLGGQIAARQSLRKSDEARGAHPIRWWRWVQAAMDLEAFSPAVARGQ